jgi:RNA polymerase sigma-70 factor (ECF subfamily)
MSTEELNSLLARCALREEKALEILYTKTSSRLYALALGIVRERERAEEVLQDAFVKVWQNAERFRPDKSGAMTWISAIVRNRALDRLREVRSNPLLRNEMLDDVTELPLLSEEQDPLDFTAMSKDMQSLQNCLGTLEQEQKQAILMSYYHGYSHQELSARLTMPLGTVKGWIRRGLEKLRLCLGDAASI